MSNSPTTPRRCWNTWGCPSGRTPFRFVLLLDEEWNCRERVCQCRGGDVERRLIRLPCASREDDRRGERSERRGDADHDEGGVESIQTGTRDEHRRHRGDTGGTTDLPHRLNEARGEPGRRVGNARQRPNLRGG